MFEAVSTQRFSAASPIDAVLAAGRPIFALAVIGLGVETFVCAHRSIILFDHRAVNPVLPLLPPIPWMAYLFGAIVAVLGAGLLFRRTLRSCALAVGAIWFLCVVVLELPKYLLFPGDVGLRTILLEPLAIGTLAWLLPGFGETPGFLEKVSRWLLGLSLIVFGVDHFLALTPIGTFIPKWIPWHVFWVGFFGVGLIAAGISLVCNILVRWSALCIGLMFAIWVFTLHLLTVIGLLIVPGNQTYPDLFSSFLIAVALWGGFWALARTHSKTA